MSSRRPPPAPPADDLAATWGALIEEQGAKDERDLRATFHPSLAGDTLGPETLRSVRLAASTRPAAAIPRAIDAGADAAGDTVPRVGAGDDGGAFKVTGIVGRGGMGVVYRAHQSVLSRVIALKCLANADAQGAGPANDKFISEALVTAHIEHPNVVPVYDLAPTDGAGLALAMKLVDGISWERLLHPRTDSERARAEDCDLDFHLDVLLSVSNAVAFAHSKQIAHCDLKPENVLIGAFGEVLLVDWGLALDISEEPWPDAIAPHRTTLTSPCGTPAYLAPELARGEGHRIDARTDVYLLGAILFELATGRPPHVAETVLGAIILAAETEGPPFREGDAVESGLRAVCERAMAPDPDDRYPDVASFQRALRDHLKHRESTLLTERAVEALKRCLRQAKALAEGDNHNDLYAAFAEAVSGFRQALLLWPDNRRAQLGERDSRVSYAQTALRFGDLGLAAAQLAAVTSLPGAEPPAAVGKLTEAIAAAGRRRDQTRARVKRLRIALAAASALVVVGLLVGFLLVRAEKHRAEDNWSLAEQRLENIRRLSDAKRLEGLTAAADELWPALPDKVAAMDAWLADARALVSRLALHDASLTALRETGRRTADGDYVFDTVETHWEHDTLAALLSGLRQLAATGIGDVERRREFATTVYRRTIEEHRAEWDEVIATIADRDRAPWYDGLVIEPQLGLIPLGPDLDSGLQEFAHLQSGAVPRRGADGRLIRTEDMGIVLVLVPGGTFSMGAERPSAEHPEGAPNVDPRAKDIEGPVHQVTLGPFFLGKYEMTQGQWEHFTGQNPSAYKPGEVIGNNTHDRLHPIELVTFDDAHRTLTRMDLTLPTEAQWEYATRAGTTTVYWTGDAPETLQGAINIADRYCRDNGGPGSWRFEEFLDDGFTVHAPVGRFRPNAFGLHDTAGNVWEWCLDRYGPYSLPVAEGTGERLVPHDGPGPVPRVFRGGGFRATTVHARSADRYSLYATDYRGYDIGVRPARAVER